MLLLRIWKEKKNHVNIYKFTQNDYQENTFNFKWEVKVPKKLLLAHCAGSLITQCRSQLCSHSFQPSDRAHVKDVARQVFRSRTKINQI